MSDYKKFDPHAVELQMACGAWDFNGKHLWTRGCFVSTVGFDEDMVKVYIQNQQQ